MSADVTTVSHEQPKANRYLILISLVGTSRILPGAREEAARRPAYKLTSKPFKNIFTDRSRVVG
jgi:hypothetical protein